MADPQDDARDQPQLYHELAPWWPLLSAPDDYEGEAALAVELLTRARGSRPDSVLELGSGGGNNAVHLKASFPEMTLVDLAEGMLVHSRALNPECEHVCGDMREVRLGRTFDAVFVHDAIMYMTTERDLLAAIETAFVHCAPGGAALFCPDHTRESYTPQTESGGHDGDTRALRYLEWDRPAEPGATTYQADYVYVLRGPDGEVRVVHDVHTVGLFPRETWTRLLEQVGFEAEMVHDEWGRDLFLCARPEQVVSTDA